MRACPTRFPFCPITTSSPPSSHPADSDFLLSLKLCIPGMYPLSISFAIYCYPTINVLGVCMSTAKRMMIATEELNSQTTRKKAQKSVNKAKTSKKRKSRNPRCTSPFFFPRRKPLSNGKEGLSFRSTKYIPFLHAIISALQFWKCRRLWPRK